MKNLIDRREFLVLGSTAAVGFVAASAVGNPLALTTRAEPFVSVGYFGGGGRSRTSHRGGGTGLLPAASLTTSDASLISSGVAVSIRGYWTPAGDQSERTVSLMAGYPTLSGNDKPQFAAWTSVLGRQRSTASNPVTFTMPVDPVDTIDLVVERSGGGILERNVVSLSVNPAPGALRLNRGFYVIAVLPSGGAVPDWGGIRLRDAAPERSDPRGAGPLLASFLGDVAPVPFDYFLVSFDTPETAAQE